MRSASFRKARRTQTIDTTVHTTGRNGCETSRKLRAGHYQGPLDLDFIALISLVVESKKSGNGQRFRPQGFRFESRQVIIPLTKRIQLCEYDPYALVSASEMYFRASRFIKVMETTARLAMTVQIKVVPQSSVFRECMAEDLDSLAEQLGELGMGRQQALALELSEFIRKHEKLPSLRGITQLRDLVHHDLERWSFLPMSPASAAYFEPKEPLFGDDVLAQFPGVWQDIEEAGKCLALSRWTASVFHLMRVLEHGLPWMANRAGITEDLSYENWHNIIERIQSRIADIGTWSKGPVKQEALRAYSDTATEFAYFKDAWRNHVAHKRLSFDEAGAKRVFSHVKAFMQQLATLPRLSDGLD